MTYRPSDSRVLAIVRAALDTGPGQRDEFVSARCHGDPELHQAVRVLLRQAALLADHEADAGEAPDPLARESAFPDRIEGTRLGAFRVCERIGRGGMGVVYRAVREDADFRQTVAIKLIRRGFDFDEVHRRFLRERRILARLNHPGLARFIDGGVSDDGRPWFALEHVEGVGLREWCDGNRLDLHSRADLFLDICAAVQYAHTQLVVHRDLKPGNILVEASGAVKLLDFGISRLLDGDEGDDQTVTMAGLGQVLTPAYAAPEQLQGGPATVAGDVYSLGVILYELMTGVLPFAFDRSDPLRSQRLVRESALPSLGQAITTGRRSSASNATPSPSPDSSQPAGLNGGSTVERLAARRTSARAFRSAVRGDLDRIVGKALESDIDQRYATVAALADDLGRWRSGLPVRVSGRGAGYRLAKFVRRNRLLVGMGVAVVMASLAGVIGTLVQLHNSRVEADRANAVQSYLVALFESAAPGAEPAVRGSDTGALLRDGIQRAHVQFAGQPLLLASMLTTLGGIQTELGLEMEAQPSLQQALDLLEQQGRGSDPLYVDALLRMARVHRIRQQFPQAHALLHRALAVTASNDLLRRARVHQLLGVIMGSQGQGDGARRELEQALALIRQAEVPPGRDTALILSDLGVVIDSGGPVEEALPYYREALELGRQLYGPVHFNVAVVLGNLGSNLQQRELFASARAPLEQAVEIHRQVLAVPHTEHARALMNLALVEIASGRPVEGEALMRSAVAMHESLLGSDHPQVALALLDLLKALAHQEKWEQAEDAIEKGVGILSRAEGDWRFEHAQFLQALSAVYSRQGLSDAALDQATKASVLVAQARGDTHPETLQAHAVVAVAMFGNGQAPAGLALLRETLDASGRNAPGEYRFRMMWLVNLAAMLVQQGDTEGALDTYHQALALSTELGQPIDASVADVRLGLAEIYQSLGREAACRAQWRQLVEIDRQAPLAPVRQRRLAALDCRGAG